MDIKMSLSFSSHIIHMGWNRANHHWYNYNRWCVQIKKTFHLVGHNGMHRSDGIEAGQTKALPLTDTTPRHTSLRNNLEDQQKNPPSSSSQLWSSDELKTEKALFVSCLCQYAIHPRSGWWRRNKLPNAAPIGWHMKEYISHREMIHVRHFLSDVTSCTMHLDTKSADHH
jgi:hypothetical protein